MRLYGGRMIRNMIRRRIEERRESRDAVVWDIDTTNRYCRVTIQGSNTYIKARWPENWESTPSWLKVGNAVRISHPGGNKGRVEIVGHGLLLPTPVSGGSTPVVPTPGDAVLSGLTLVPSSPGGMSATVSTGTYRIDGITYVLGAISMDRTDIEMDRSDIEMDRSADVVFFDAASATHFRYDIVVVGTDGDAHVVKGNNATGEPTMPSVPEDHVMAGWLLIYPGMTEITEADICRVYTEPYLVEMRVVVSDGILEWSELTSTITISIRDQYGRVLSGTYHLTASFLRGNGTLAGGGKSCSPPSSMSIDYDFFGSTSLTYTRNRDEDDDSPIFEVSESATGFYNIFKIDLLDEDGDLMFIP